MNVSNYTNAYEAKLNVVESKLKSVASNDRLSDTDKASETRELEQEKEQLQKKIDTSEDAKKKEELSKLMDSKGIMDQMSTMNTVRRRLDSNITVAKSQYEADIARGGDEEASKERIEELEKRRESFTENILEEIFEKDDKKRRIFSDEDEEEEENKGLYKGNSYKKRVDIKV